MNNDDQQPWNARKELGGTTYLSPGQFNLNTETPTKEAIVEAAEEVMRNDQYKNKATEMHNKMAQCQSEQLCADYIRLY